MEAKEKLVLMEGLITEQIIYELRFWLLLLDFLKEKPKKKQT